MSKKLDTIGYYIIQFHQLLGHDKAAVFLGQPSYNKNTCILCMYDKGEATQEQVLEQLGVS